MTNNTTPKDESGIPRCPDCGRARHKRSCEDAAATLALCAGMLAGTVKEPDCTGTPDVDDIDWQPQRCRCGGTIRQQLLDALICGSCGRTP